MSPLDLAVVAIVAFYAFLGYRRGFLAVFAELLALALGFGAAAFGYRHFGGDPNTWAPALIFIAIWVTVTAVLELLFRLTLRRVREETRKSRTNRVLGILPSAVKGVVAAALLATLYVVASRGKADPLLQTSLITPPLVDGVLWFQGTAVDTFGGAVEEFQQRLGRSAIIDGDSTVPLGFQTTDVRVDAAAELEMLQLVNRERRAEDLPPLKMNTRLQVVARSHALDMVHKGYFAHISPDGLDPFERMRRAGITYRVAGENLAFARSAAKAHDGLMKSPGHRRNILTKGFRQVGIGTVDAGPHGRVFAQEFTD